MKAPLLRLSFCSALAVATLLMGCDDRNSATVYQAPKESQAGPVDRPVPVETTATDASGGAPNWAVPGTWKQLPAQEMRYATFQIDPNDPNLTILIFCFGQEMGGLLPNVVQWEQQIGAPVSDEKTVGNVVTHLQNNNLQIDCVDLKVPAKAGQIDGIRQLEAIIHHDPQVWFVKFVGPESKITSHQAEYESFVKSISFPASPAVVAAPIATPPPPATPDLPAAESGGPSLKAYATPDGWTLDPQPRPMRLMTFHAGPVEQKTDLIVTALPANGFGSELDNLNRWLGQAGMDPVTDPAAVQPVATSVGGSNGSLFDFTGPKAEVYVVEVTHGPYTWFFKLIGPATAVQQQKKPFDAFLKSVAFE